MSRQVRFTAPSFVRRIIRAEDFEAVGVTDQGTVEFYARDLKNKGIQEVSDAAAAYLVANDKFEYADEAPQAEVTDEVTLFDGDSLSSSEKDGITGGE